MNTLLMGVNRQGQIPVSSVVFQWFLLGREARQWFVTSST